MRVPKPSHSRRVPKRSERNRFSKATRKAIFDRDEGKCQQCGDRGTQIHHIVPRSRGGRGVVSNGMTVCFPCHQMIHDNPNLLNDWIRHYKSFFGDGFWKDEWD